MSTEKSQVAEALANPLTLGEQIAQGIADGIAKLQPKKVSFGEYQKRHPRPKLERESYDNGHRISPDVITVEEANLLNQITTSGRYIKRKVEVIVRNEGRPLNEQVLEIRYSDKSPDQRMENKGLFKNFVDLLKQIVLEQEVNEENQEVVRPAKSRTA